MIQILIIIILKFWNMANKTECIRVIIRCRPLSEQEMKDGREVAVKMIKETGEILI